MYPMLSWRSAPAHGAMFRRCATGCGTLSEWSNSRYVRHLADAALGDRPVRIDLSVRRLCCENAACPNITFAEQVPGLTVRYQRRTPRGEALGRRVVNQDQPVRSLELWFRLGKL
jgi:hypothetical protein